VLELIPSLWFPALVLVLAASGLAAWPYFTKHAPYGFWLVVLLIWMVSGAAALLLFAAVRVLLRIIT
jgi:hypothetical protein